MSDCQVESIVFTNKETIEAFTDLLCGFHADIEAGEELADELRRRML